MKKYLIWLLLLATGFGMGWWLKKDEKLVFWEIRQNGYQYISPLLECETDLGGKGEKYKKLKKDLSRFIESKKNERKVSEVAVYYRDLNNGPWFGINEDINFDPASLLKVPVMMAYLKEAENEPNIMNPEVVELMDKMIAKSDNEAFAKLVEGIDNDKIQRIHYDLGLRVVRETTPEDFVSVKDYASLFRVLYNASYLNKRESEQGLEFLAKAEFDQGLEAGVPKDIVVAHKFGVRIKKQIDEKQLHDCGIVYTAKPYLLCVMTRGEEIKKQEEVISQISRKCFEAGR